MTRQFAFLARRVAAALARRLLRLSLFAKILIANSALVLLGALAAAALVTWQVRHPEAQANYSLVIIFWAGVLALSLGANAIVLHTAFIPLLRLERVARRVRDGDLAARATPGLLGDSGTDQLAATVNTMLDRLAERTREAEASSARLQALSDSVLIAQEAERLRLSRELHDHIGQELSSLLLSLRLFRDALDQVPLGIEAAREQTAELSEQVRETLGAVRRLALELHPRLLEDLGLAIALKTCVEEWGARTGTATSFTSSLPEETPLPDDAQVALYRMVQEVLANTAQCVHAAHVAVSLSLDRDVVVLQVWNDDPSAPGGGPIPDVGLFGVQERIALAGGRFNVASTPGEGTVATARVPVAVASAHGEGREMGRVTATAAGTLA